jgi:hypothetical protein
LSETVFHTSEDWAHSDIELQKRIEEIQKIDVEISRLVRVSSTLHEFVLDALEERRKRMVTFEIKNKEDLK